MLEDKDYDMLNAKYVGSLFGDLRRERSKLMQQLIFQSDASVKPRIREITQQLTDIIKSGLPQPKR